MKRNSRIISFCIMAMLCMFLVACGNVEKTNKGDNTEAVSVKEIEKATYEEKTDVFLINNNVYGVEYTDGSSIDMNSLNPKGGKVVTEKEVNIYNQQKECIGYIKSGVTVKKTTESNEWVYVTVTDGSFFVRADDLKDLTVVFGNNTNANDNTEVSNIDKEPTYTVTDITEKTMYAKQIVNVRSGPSSDYEKVGSLTTNQEVTVTGQAGTGWYRIDYNGGVAFVSNNYLSDTKVEATTPSNNGGNTNENENNSGGEDIPPTDDIIIEEPEPTYTYTVDEVIAIVESTLRAAGLTKPEESMTLEQLEKYGPTDGMGWGIVNISMTDPYTDAKLLLDGYLWDNNNYYYLEYQGTENGEVVLKAYWG